MQAIDRSNSPIPLRRLTARSAFVTILIAAAVVRMTIVTAGAVLKMPVIGKMSSHTQRCRLLLLVTILLTLRGGNAVENAEVAAEFDSWMREFGWVHVQHSK